VFAGEQAEGAFKFWGDQRLPVGWLWLRRTALWAVVIAAVSAVALLAAWLHVTAQREAPPGAPAALLDRMLGGPPLAPGALGVVTFLVMWPAYGFALGQFCALVWRKSAVAVVVAALTAAGAACLWLPSLLAGGLHPVQVLGVPLLLLAACRLSLWAWVTDRLRTWGSIVRLMAAVSLTSVWVAANFALRVWEAPAAGEPFDLAALKARLGSPEEAKPGVKIREALQALDVQKKAFQGALPPHPLAPANQGPARDFDELAAHVAEEGWGGPDPPFEFWLDQLAAGPWVGDLRQAAAVTPGVLISPLATTTAQDDARQARKAAVLLTALSLRPKARDEDVALDYLVTALALSRHMRHQGPPVAYLEGLEAERVALGGVRQWLARLPKPEALRRALDELARHESATPPATEALAGEYLRFISEWGSTSNRRASGDTEMMILQVPWEAARARRLVATLFAGRRRLAEAGAVPQADDTLLADWMPDGDGPSRERLAGLLGSSWSAASLPVTAPLQRAALLGLCRARAARLQAALVLYQSRHGTAPPSLEALVPALLPELPDDPFARQPFRYRVSRGEPITWPRGLPAGGAFPRDVPAGQAILWSVGPDGTDDGGTSQWDGDAKGPGRDVIFLVPPPAGRRER
jgi:hypothetical protein